MKKLLLFLFIANFVQVLASSSAFSNISLKVYDTDGMNRYTAGNIDTMLISVTPQGIYAEIGVYMTISPKPYNYFKFPDSLEVEYKFSLPENASMIDSWLWFEGYIIKAKHYDRWTGHQIYENIVKRTRKDPSIIYKNSATQYEMRIFPIQPDRNRKVKMTYLIPMNIDSKSATVNLPFDLASVSNNKATYKEVVVFSNSEFRNPRLKSSNNPDLFVEQTDEFFGQHKKAVIGTGANTAQTMIFDSPMTNGIYLYADNSYKTYQTVYDANTDLQRQPKKLMFVYSNSCNFKNQYNSKGLINHKAVLDQLRDMLKSNMNSKDSFNIMAPDYWYPAIAENWEPCTPEKIDELISKIDTSRIDLYQSLSSMLIYALAWVQSNSNKADIILLTEDIDYFNSYYQSYNEDGLINKSNQLITELNKKNSHSNSLHILDLNVSSSGNMYVNGINYRNNQYLHANLVNFFNGSLVELLYKPLTIESLSGAFSELKDNIFRTGTIIDLDIDVENGFTYSEYILPNSNDRIISQVGKFVGDTLFNYRLIRIDEGNVSSKTTVVNTMPNNLNYYKTNQIIAGLEIKDYEKISNPSPQIVHSIINTALGNRVLSKYTVFLALEFGDTLNTTINSDEVGDDDNHTSVSDEIISDFATISANPNPFSSTTNIKCKINGNEAPAPVEIFVSDVLGNKVRRLTDNSIPFAGELSMLWDGRTDSGEQLPAGVYFITLRLADRQITIKVMKM